MTHHLTALDTLFGIKGVQLVAGLAGGLVRALLAPAKTIGTIVTSCVVGGLTAGYLTPIAAPFLADKLSVPEGASLEPVTGFLVGLTAMAICEFAIGWVSAYASRHRATPKEG
jgi:hypothetical protein